MRQSMSYIPCVISSKGKTCNVITFANFSEGKFLAETSEDEKSNGKSGDKSSED